MHVINDSVQPATFGAVEFVLDASGSMLQRIGGERRIEIAKSALIGLTDALPADSGFALRVFGHKEADSCQDGSRDQATKSRQSRPLLQRSKPINAMNLAKTPIAASLLKVKEDLAAHQRLRCS